MYAGLEYEVKCFVELVMIWELKVLCFIFFVIIEMKKDFGVDVKFVFVVVVGVFGGGLMGVGISYVIVVKVKILVCIKDVVNDGVFNVFNYNYKLFDK